MTHHKIFGVILFLSFVGLSVYSSAVAATQPQAVPHHRPTLLPRPLNETNLSLLVDPQRTAQHTDIQTPKKMTMTMSRSVGQVPFYSQFTDISSPTWQKVGCGIASLAMLIDYYSDETSIDVNALLQSGIKRGAYASDAGWSHAGLIALAEEYGLTGASHSLANLSATAAFAELEKVLVDGPVMVSVHYTFEPTNPIPHLVVVTGVDNDRIYYNDPAEKSGNNSISIEKFKRAWKQRYIDIKPHTS